MAFPECSSAQPKVCLRMNDSHPPVIPSLPPAPGLLRRMAIVCYDLLLLFGLLFFAGALVIVPLGLGFGSEIQGHHLLFRLYLGLVILWFYCGFWVNGGQTLGMRTWRVRLVDVEGRTPSWRQALIRFAAAILSWAALGLGFLWVLVDRDRLAWHDRLSGTRLVMVGPATRS